jgi:hypothetical protein
VVPSNFDDDDPQWYDHKFILIRCRKAKAFLHYDESEAWIILEHASDSS